MPMNREIEVKEKNNLLNVLNDSDIYVEGTCGGRGTCGKCKVKILNKKLPITDSDKKKLTEAELKEGYRLACRVEINADLKIEVPSQAKEDDRKSSISSLSDLEVSSSFKKHYIELPKPVLKDQAGDFERIKRVLPERDVQISLNILRKIPKILRDAKFKITVTLYNNIIIDVEKGDTREHLYGVAFDIGTTTVVGALINLNNGETISISSIGNPQRSFGADVISRITYAAEEDGLKTLRKKVIEGMNGIIEDLCSKNNIEENNIYHIATVGNTTMHHLFLGVDPTYVARAPYIPGFQNGQRFKANEVGFFVNPDACVYVVPNIAGYVGADTVGVVLDTHIESSEEIKLAIDIGTNGEVLLGSGDKLLACSTAAGPAFEGAQIKYGMRAAEGAIEKVQINEKCEIKTIGNKPPVGICGSGLLDAVAQLVKVGVVDSSGRMLSPDEVNGLSEDVRSRIVKGKNGYDFVLAEEENAGINEPVLLTQKDVRELQLAKGAIYAGIKVMQKELGINDEEISEIILAGAFGSYIDRESALGIGLVPEVDIEKINSVGNSAGRGSQMVLISDREKERSIQIAKNVEYIELSTNQDFQTEYMLAMNFPSK
jgi:uncharacterized 2Fe-2S/4Fe-4S cluster protein (DUF4445 family)